MAFLQRLGWAALFLALGYVGLYYFIHTPIYSDHPPRQALEGLAMLDIRKQPGSPGTRAEAAGGVLPKFRRTLKGQTIRWDVLSGEEVAVSLTATGTAGWLYGSYIKANVARGTAPEERLSPAFRSEALTLGLFKSAIADSLDLIGSPGWGPRCDAVHQDLLAEESGPVYVFFFIEDDLLESGCDFEARPLEFRPVVSQMEGAPQNR